MMKRTISIFLALLIALGVFPLWISAVEPLDNPFEDVTESDWFWKEVLTVNEEGIMTGKSATVFDPKANISRAEVVTALARFACVNVQGKGELLTFTDTWPDEWYSDYVGWAYENGIVTGYTNGKFGPSDLITRQELAVVLSRMIAYLEANMPENPQINKFADSANIADWVAPHAETMRRAGLMKGDTNGNFNATNNASRAEVATIISRMLPHTGRIAVVENGKSDYKIVVNSDDLGAAIAAERLQYLISEKLDVEIKIINDASYNGKKVVLGSVSGIVADGLGADGYKMNVDGENILINGKDDGLLEAVNRLTSLCIKNDYLTLTKKASETYVVEKNSMQIIPDLTFQNGLQLISQKDHANGDAVTVLDTHDFYGTSAVNPVWRLCQWDSGPCLVANRVESAPTTITDGVGRSFSFDHRTNTMTFELDSSIYYQGKHAVEGDYWPHILIEQGEFTNSMTADEAKYLNCDADRLVLSMDIRLSDFNETIINGDWVRATQFLMYFYVKGIETNDFCWFQLFDNRADMTDNYVAYDGGKPDASGAMIYSIGSRYVYQKSGRTLYSNGKPDAGGEWVHVEINLKPYLEDMLKKGAEDGYFKVDSLSELYINGMNVGWETIATFDNTMQIKNLKLVSYMGDKAQ